MKLLIRQLGYQIKGDCCTLSDCARNTGSGKNKILGYNCDIKKQTASEHAFAGKISQFLFTAFRGYSKGLVKTDKTSAQKFCAHAYGIEMNLAL